MLLDVIPPSALMGNKLITCTQLQQCFDTMFVGKKLLFNFDMCIHTMSLHMLTHKFFGRKPIPTISRSLAIQASFAQTVLSCISYLGISKHGMAVSTL